MVVAKARVLRDGKELEINSEDLVPGDIVFLASGSRVPADLRLIKTIELRADESMLTGESIPAEKMASSHPGGQSHPRRPAQYGLYGDGGGQRPGQRGGGGHRGQDGPGPDRHGRPGTRVTKSPLQEKIDRFAKTIGIIVLVASALLFLIGILVGISAKDMFMTAVAAAVAAIPEGLPIVVTITLAIGVARMAQRNAIIRKLPAVETLGSTTVICSDKTGTLTKNEMTVKRVYDGGPDLRTYRRSGYEPKGDILEEWRHVNTGADPELHMLFRIGLLCNESDLYEEEGVYKVDGDPTEAALIVSAMKAGLNAEEERENYPQLSSFPLSPNGAIWPPCTGTATANWCSSKARRKNCWTSAPSAAWMPGRRSPRWPTTLPGKACGCWAWPIRRSLPPAEITMADLQTGLIFAGLQGMIDPPRPEAIDAVAGCKGGHPGGDDYRRPCRHRGAIARKLGIEGKVVVEDLVAKPLEAMTDEELLTVTQEAASLARRPTSRRPPVSPASTSRP